MNCPNNSSSNAVHLITNTTAAHLPQACASQSTLEVVIRDFFVMLGGIAFLMIVIAGLRYVLARGNPERTTQAKNTIQYAVIGLIIAALAFSIVTVIIDRSS